MQHPESFIEKEIKMEFQLERMILFSDAVFAIVITLMAIDIKIPETDSFALTPGELKHHLLHLVPIFLAYAFSFFFIGRTWYAHLQLFGFLKKYNAGLVFCNLLLLFSIGLFPFGASVLVHVTKSYLNFIVYFSILGLCQASQLYLRYYVLIKHPGLRNDRPIEKELLKYKLSISTVLVALVGSLLVVITNMFIVDPEKKDYSVIWLLPVVIIIRILRSRSKAKQRIVK